MSTTAIEAFSPSAPEQPRRYTILGLPVDAVDMKGALEQVDRMVRGSLGPGHILAANPEKVFAVRASSFLADFFGRAAMIVPDGIGIVFALRRLYGVRVTRTAGSDLMMRICAAAQRRGYRIFIYGASEEVNVASVAKLQRQFPGIQITGRANGYLRETEMPRLIRQINESQTDILFVGLGSPKQEQWMHRWLPELKVKVCQGIGGTLDTIAGRIKRAPLAWQRLGLEWLYRLLKQPWRIARQRRLAVFVWEVLKEWTRMNAERRGL